MSENIPALIAEARKLMADSEYGDRHDRTRMIESLVTALESLSSPPATDDALPERLEAQATFVPETRMADVMREAAEVIRAARRPSPVTREAPTSGIYIHGPLGEALRPALPEPAEDEWEYGLGEPFDAVPRMTGSESLVVRMQKIHGGEIFKRTAPGDWVPVKGTEQ